MAVVSINELKSYFDKVGKKPTTSQYENLIDTLTTTTVGGLVSVTYAQMQAAILAGSINAGRIYKITDRGDLGLYFIGLSNTTLDFKNGARDMLVPLTYQTGNFGGFDWLGIWNSGLTPSIGNLVIWGGHVWRNLSGNVGSYVDDFSLDAEWELMTKSIGMYKVQTLGCNYDFENDWVSRAWDNRGNVAGCSYGFAQLFGYTVNPVNHCDWGDMITVISNNNVLYFCNNISPVIAGNNLGTYFISGNTTGNVIVNNSNKGAISNNSNGGDILSNSNAGNISNNSNTGAIVRNSNGGDINSNSNIGVISLNSNSGNVNGNYNTGDISNNGNLGYISSNSNAGSILNNSNIENIFNNSNGGQILINSNGGSISGNLNGGSISSNSNKGQISGNTNGGSITKNSNLGAIESNTPQVLDISDNSNAGYINDNANTGNITNNGNMGDIQNNTSQVLNISGNSNAGGINGNSNTGSISNNGNLGYISANSNAGQIITNSNSGYIQGLTSVVLNVYNNINNGDISTSTAGDIFDTVVNK